LFSEQARTSLKDDELLFADMGSSLFSHLCNVGKLAGFSGATPYFLIVQYPPE
jgi:hypothetical protein